MATIEYFLGLYHSLSQNKYGIVMIGKSDDGIFRLKGIEEYEPVKEQILQFLDNKIKYSTTMALVNITSLNEAIANELEGKMSVSRTPITDYEQYEMNLYVLEMLKQKRFIGPDPNSITDSRKRALVEELRNQIKALEYRIEPIHKYEEHNGRLIKKDLGYAYSYSMKDNTPDHLVWAWVLGCYLSKISVVET